jgi:hypothetical protein
MSETPEKKKARLRYDNVFKTAWSDEFHFIKHSRKGKTKSGRGVYFSEGRNLLHFGYKICVVKTLNIV